MKKAIIAIMVLAFFGCKKSANDVHRCYTCTLTTNTYNTLTGKQVVYFDTICNRDPGQMQAFMDSNTISFWNPDHTSQFTQTVSCQ